MDTRKLIAEAVGTFILVGMGSMAILATGAMAGSPALVVIPIGFGLGLLAAIAVGGHVSGGHFNPAVTLGAFLDKRIDADRRGRLRRRPGRRSGRRVGVILVISDSAAVAGTKNMPGAAGDMTGVRRRGRPDAIFVAVILTVTKKAAEHALFVIPLTLLAIHAVGIPFSGASVNPARALGPAIVSLDFAAIWIYLTAPFAGAVIGWLVFRVLSAED